MEDNEEMRSQSSKDTASPASPRSDGRIAVTVAVSAPPSTKAVAVALPVQQQSKPAGGGREDCWSESATAVLIEAWGERYLELSRGNLKQTHWKDIAEIVNGQGGDFTKTPKSDIQCKNRIDTVKKKFKLEKAKISAGHGPSRWAFFDKMDWLIGPAAKINNAAGSGGGYEPPANTGNHKVPMGIPMGARSAPPLRQHQPSPPPPQKQKQAFQKPPPAYSDSSDSETEVSADSLPPATNDRKRPRGFMNSSFVKPEMQRATGTGIGEKHQNWGKSIGELSEAILKFGEAYERTESARIQQMVEIEKQRMKFAKEMELQRMQFFMKTQMDLSQLHNRSRPIKKANNNKNTAAAATIKNSNNISSGNIN
ncbi:PREDICTED: trihelix transcription factor ASIL2-like [Ipomoea nil]|uniref:trihelix transcription factor ASIL2-like n=1 Tax=Ipomoea nil TaxID=35883 RepID=UPI00090174A3|nr:PREDICTED: trihelix transcription factor ASIL2-like [Ipomoea nil]